MQYINGNDISRLSINEVLELAQNTTIPWNVENEESNSKYLILSHTLKGGLYLSKGVCVFNISPEKLYEILYNIKLRSKWDYHCQHAEILEDYDHLNHIIHLKFTNPLIDNLEMNLYRSCKYDPQSRIFVIAMRSIVLEDSSENQFECLPNGWVIQGILGEKDKCKLIFIQQCQERDIDLQRMPGYKSFESKETLQDFKFLTLFPATVCGRLGTIFEALDHFINNNKEVQEIQDSRISIMEKAEKEVNEMFGTTNPDYGWKIYLKKLDMEILIKKTNQGYYMIGKGSFSSMFPPSLLADVLYHKNPFEWDTFYDKTELIEDINDSVREVEVHYRMWRNTINMRLLQSVKKGPGNFSAVHWRSISSPGYKVTDGIEVHYLPTGLLNYGLGQGSFTSFLAAIEVKGYPTPWEEEMVTKLFAARIISNQNSIMNHVNKLTNSSHLSRTLPVIPTIEHHCGTVGQQIGSPQVYNEMVESFANILLSDENKDKKNNIASSKNKRKRNGPRNDEENEIQSNEQDGANLSTKQQQQQQLQQQMMRPSIRLPNVISSKNSNNMEQTPIQWNESKKQPFLFLVSDSSSGRKGKLQRKSYYYSNSSFDSLPEELIHIIFFHLTARDIINVSLVCKRFKMTTDNPNLWKNLFNNNPMFNKKVPKKKFLIELNDQQEQIQVENSTQISTPIDQQVMQQSPLEMAGININDPISLLTTLTNGNVTPDLSQTDIMALGQLISQVNFTDFSNIDQVLSQLPPQIMALIPMDTIHAKIQEMKSIMKMVSGMPSTNQDSLKFNNQPNNQQSNNNNNSNNDKMNTYLQFDEDINWKAQYTERFKQSNNWIKLKPSNKIELKGHTKAIKSVKTEGNSAVSIGNEKKVRFWNLNSGECFSTYEESQTSPISIEYDRTQKSNTIWPISDFTKVYIGFKNGSVSIVDFFEQPIKGHTFNRMSLLADGFDFSYHGKFFIWEDKISELWDVESSTRLWQETATHSKKIVQAKLQLSSTISNDGIALTTSSDKTAKIWNLGNGQLISTLNGHTNAVNCIESIGDYLLLTGSSDKTLKLWDIRQAHTFLANYSTSHTQAIRCLSYQEKNGIVLSGSDDGSVIGWSLDNWDFSNIEPVNLVLPTIPSIPNPPQPENQPIVNTQPNNTPTVTNTQQQILQQQLPKISLGQFKESSKITLPIKSSINCIDSDEAGFISGSSNGIIYRWDFNN